MEKLVAANEKQVEAATLPILRFTTGNILENSNTIHFDLRNGGAIRQSSSGCESSGTVSRQRVRAICSAVAVGGQRKGLSQFFKMSHSA